MVLLEINNNTYKGPLSVPYYDSAIVFGVAKGVDGVLTECRSGDEGVMVLASEPSMSLLMRACLPRKDDIFRSDGSLTSETRLAARVLFQSSASTSGISGAGKKCSSLTLMRGSSTEWATTVLSTELCALNLDRGRSCVDSGSDERDELSVNGVVLGESNDREEWRFADSCPRSSEAVQSAYSSAEWKDSVADDVGRSDSSELPPRGISIGDVGRVCSALSSYIDRTIRGRLR